MQLKARNSQSNKTKKFNYVKDAEIMSLTIKSIRETNQSTETENKKVCLSFKVQTTLIYK
jgi:hypothetical protein